MNGKIKYLTVLLIAVLVSAATSYVTTSLYLSGLSAQSSTVGQVDVNNLPPQMVQQISDEIVLELTKTNVSLPFELKSHGGRETYVHVNSSIALENLTITYRYAGLSDGAVHVESYDYGTFVPAWGDGVVITYGQAPDAYYRVPDSVVEQSGRTTMIDENVTVSNVPDIEVVGVFGYL